HTCGSVRDPGPSLGDSAGDATHARGELCAAGYRRDARIHAVVDIQRVLGLHGWTGVQPGEVERRIALHSERQDLRGRRTGSAHSRIDRHQGWGIWWVLPPRPQLFVRAK